MTASLWWLISNDRVRETPGTLRSIGKVVPDLGEPDQVAGGVPRLDGNLNPVLSGAVIVLLLDLARGGHGFSDLDRLGELGVDEPNGSAILSDHAPRAGYDRRECRHRHHSMTDRLRDAEHLGTSGPFFIGMNEIGIYRTPLSGIGETGDICARRRQDQRAPPAGLEDAPLVPKIE